MKIRSSRILLALVFIVSVLALVMIDAAASGDKKKKKKARAKTPAAKPAKPAKPVVKDEAEENDPDLPAGVKINKGEYLRLRDEHLALIRGTNEGGVNSRVTALRQMEQQEQLARAHNRLNSPAVTWSSIGPAPVPNGQTNPPSSDVSGRVSAIAAHPTNPDIAYVGGAQAGVYRTTDGGVNWTPIFDSALSLAIGAITFAPNDPTTIWVGTGEPAFSADAFFGVGLYRIRNADSRPVLDGPFTLDLAGNDVFTGRAISEIVIDPNNPNTLFVATASGTSGLGGGAPPLPQNAGLYRTTNALAAIPQFKKLNVATANIANRSISDLAMEPGNANRVIAFVRGLPGAGDGGIYVSDNALATDPVFRQTYNTIATATASLRGELAINKVGSVVTVIAAFGDNNGTVIKSENGGETWPTTLTAGAGFCNPQCFYDIAVAIDPADAQKVYLAGAPNTVFKRSLNGGTSFTESSAGLHVDSHAITVAPSNPNVIYFGSDGGVWRSNDAGVTWLNRNNSGLASLQYQALALHPTDATYTLGGTQDNGTHYRAPGATGVGGWIFSDGGDGGFCAIDQNAVTILAGVAYHCYFSATTTQVGYIRATTNDANGDPIWSGFRGCRSGSTNNGILCADPVLFYAPLVLGPGVPNTVYYGTNKLYRSADTGTTNTIVSQTLPNRISAIAIGPTDDAVRVVGLETGRVYVSTDAAATTMREITGPIPAKYVGRVAIDPLNKERAYVALTGYGVPNGQHIWRTENLSSASPVWQPAGFGIPDVPVNSLAIDPAAPQQIFAGTDIGVYRTTDFGNTWQPDSEGFPRAAVFDMKIHATHRFIRAATHGRSMYEAQLGAAPPPVPTPSPTGLFTRFSAASYTANEGAGVFNVTVETNSMGGSTVDYAISGVTASQRTDFNLAAGTLTFAPGQTSQTIPVLLVDDFYVEGDETILLSLFNSNLPPGSQTSGTATLTIISNDTVAPSASPSPSNTALLVAQLDGAQEVPPVASTANGGGTVAINTAGDTITANLSFTGLSSAQTAAHIHGFAPVGQNAPVLFNLGTGTVTNANFTVTPAQLAQLQAGNMYFNVHTQNFPGGEIRGQILANPLDGAKFFVRQQYLDFLNREPDTAGFNFWVGEIVNICGADLACINSRRIGVSAAFFIELEFQETGSVIYRLYKTAFGIRPTYAQFAPDRSELVGGAGLPASTSAFAARFVQRGMFLNEYPTALTNAEFVNKLFDKAGLVGFATERQAQIGVLNGGGTRAQVLLNVSGLQAVRDREFNPSFVLMQYFGYLRRDPDEAGYNFWLDILNRQPQNFRGMVCAFTTSTEYQQRFAAPALRTNALCDGNP